MTQVWGLVLSVHSCDTGGGLVLSGASLDTGVWGLVLSVDSFVTGGGLVLSGASLDTGVWGLVLSVHNCDTCVGFGSVCSQL